MEATTQNLDTQRQADSVLLFQELRRGEIDERAREYIWRQESLYLSELLEGQVRSDNDFEMLDGRMVCRDSEGYEIDWMKFHDNGIKNAEQRAAADKKLLPYIDIALAEKAEAELQQKYINQPTPRMLISYSLCGNDLFNDEVLLSLGRWPAKKRGFVRVSVFDGRGSMKVQCRSIDGLSSGDVEAQYNYQGVQITPGLNTIGILSSPIVLNYANYNLIDELAPKQGIDTFKFVQSQTDLVGALINGLDNIASRYSDIEYCAQLSENLRYDIASSLKHRLEGRWKDSGSLGGSVAAAGNAERAVGTEYRGCETVVGAKSVANRLGLFSNGEEKTDCVTCKNCSKVVNLPKDLHKVGYLHCVECQATFSKKEGRYLSKKETKVLLDRQKSGSEVKVQTISESFSQWVCRLGQEVKLRNQQKRLQEQKLRNKAD